MNKKENSRRRRQARLKFFSNNIERYITRKYNILNMIHDHMRNNGIPVMFTDLDLVGSDSRLLIIAPVELHKQIKGCINDVKWVPEFILKDIVMMDTDYGSSKK